jgi:predicted RNase H-like nuclease (RuvC/YqgF family)
MGITGLWRENESVDVPSGVVADGGDGGVVDTPTPRDVLDQGFIQGLTAVMEENRKLGEKVGDLGAGVYDLDAAMDRMQENIDDMKGHLKSLTAGCSLRHDSLKARAGRIEVLVGERNEDITVLLGMMADMEKQNRILEMRVQYIAGENLALHRQQDCVEDDYLSKFREANNRISQMEKQISNLASNLTVVVFVLFFVVSMFLMFVFWP